MIIAHEPPFPSPFRELPGVVLLMDHCSCTDDPSMCLIFILPEQSMIRNLHPKHIFQKPGFREKVTCHCHFCQPVWPAFPYLLRHLWSRKLVLHAKVLAAYFDVVPDALSTTVGSKILNAPGVYDNRTIHHISQDLRCFLLALGEIHRFEIGDQASKPRKRRDPTD